jgi:hypothetical protein
LLDDANVKSIYEINVTKLRAAETDLIADDASKTSELVQHRAKIDLLTGKFNRAHQAVLDAEQVVIRSQRSQSN